MGISEWKIEILYYKNKERIPIFLISKSSKLTMCIFATSPLQSIIKLFQYDFLHFQFVWFLIDVSRISKRIFFAFRDYSYWMIEITRFWSKIFPKIFQLFYVYVFSIYVLDQVDFTYYLLHHAHIFLPFIHHSHILIQIL